MSATTEQPSDRFLTMLGVGSGIMQIVVFTAVGVIALESVPYGVAVGGLSGAGTFLFLPWFIGLTAAQEEGESLAAAADRVSRSADSGLFGLGLEVGAIGMFALALVRGPDLLLGLPAGLAAAVGIYLVGSVALGQ